MDFKYIKLKKKEDEDYQDRGKINFYIINKKYEFMKDFFTKEMFKNLLIVINLDLEKPETLESDCKDWMNFINSSIREVLERIDVVSRDRIFLNF